MSLLLFDPLNFFWRWVANSSFSRILTVSRESLPLFVVRAAAVVTTAISVRATAVILWFASSQRQTATYWCWILVL